MIEWAKMAFAILSTVLGVYAAMDNRLDLIEQKLIKMEVQLKHLEGLK